MLSIKGLSTWSDNTRQCVVCLAGVYETMSRRDFRAYIGLAAMLAAQTAAVAADGPLPITKISVDASKQIVVQFGSGAFPTVPHVLDLPGPNHRVVLDFTDAALDKGSLPSAEDLSAAINQALPFVKSLRYSNLENAPQPTARVVLDLPEDLKVKPHVVKLEDGMITVSLGDNLPVATAASAAVPNSELPQAATVASAVAPAQPVVTVASAAAPAEQSAAATPAQQPAAPAAPVSNATAPGGNGGWDWSSNAAPAAAAPAATTTASADTSP